MPVEFDDFRRLRAGLIINLPAASGRVLKDAEAKLHARLDSSAMFAGVEVEATDDEDHLLVAMVRYRPGTSPRRVASYLEAIWVTEMKLPGLDAFHFLVEDGHVELQAVTGDREHHYFLTLHLIAQEGIDVDFDPSLAARMAVEEREAGVQAGVETGDEADGRPKKRWLRR